MPDLRLLYTHTRQLPTHIDREVIYPSRNTVDEIERRSSHVTLDSRVRVYPPPHLCACVCRRRGLRRPHIQCIYTHTSFSHLFVRMHVCSMYVDPWMFPSSARFFRGCATRHISRELFLNASDVTLIYPCTRCISHVRNTPPRRFLSSRGSSG